MGEGGMGGVGWEGFRVMDGCQLKSEWMQTGRFRWLKPCPSRTTARSRARGCALGRAFKTSGSLRQGVWELPEWGGRLGLGAPQSARSPLCPSLEGPHTRWKRTAACTGTAAMPGA